MKKERVLTLFVLKVELLLTVLTEFEREVVFEYSVL